MRFKGIQGECQDEKHPGEEWWFTITRFNFGFGWGGGAAAARNATTTGQRPTTGPPTHQNPSHPSSGSTDKTLKPDHCTFSKNSDVASKQLLEYCYKAKIIEFAEVEACRPGGTLDRDEGYDPEDGDNSAKAGSDEKTAFLQLRFENVQIIKCSLAIAADALPSESLEFTYGKFIVKTIWTDNTTGKRTRGKPRIAEWDFQELQTKAE